MKSKTMSLLILGTFASLLLVSFASATLTLSATTPATLSQTGTSFTFNVISDTNITDNVNFTATTITDSNSNTITFTTIPSASHTFVAGVPQTLTMNYVVSPNFVFNLGKVYSTTITATGATSGATTSTASFDIANPSQYIEHIASDGKLDLSIDDLNVDSGFGKDTSWYPLDHITAKLDIQNNNANSGDKIRNIYVKWGLYDQNTGKWVVGITKESKFTLNRGDSKTLTLNFQLDSPDKFNNHESDTYIFYAWATGDNDATTNATSVYDKAGIDMNIESDFVVLDSINVPDSVACGTDTQLTADVWNIGDSDQNNVYVQVINTKLGINQQVNIGDINSFEKATLNLPFTVPSDIEEGSYPIKLSVYDDSNNVYENSNNDQAVFTKTLTVAGSCVFNPKLTITASVLSGGKAGQELDVTATVKNTDTKLRTFDVNAAGFASWANLIDVSPTKVSIDAGKSADITIKLNVNNNVEGEQNFNVELTEGTKVIPQPVSVNIQKTQLFSFLTGSAIKGDNWYLWAIGALNVLLVVVIILVAVKVSRKK